MAQGHCEVNQGERLDEERERKRRQDVSCLHAGQWWMEGEVRETERGCWHEEEQGDRQGGGG